MIESVNAITLQPVCVSAGEVNGVQCWAGRVRDFSDLWTIVENAKHEEDVMQADDMTKRSAFC